MGAKQSKTDAAKQESNSGVAIQTHHSRRQTNFRFKYGVDSKFWVLLEITDPLAYSAETLYSLIVKESNVSSYLIVGVKYLDDDFERTCPSRPAQFFVYCKYFNTVQLVWERLTISKFAVCGIYKISRILKEYETTAAEKNNVGNSRVDLYLAQACSAKNQDELKTAKFLDSGKASFQKRQKQGDHELKYSDLVPSTLNTSNHKYNSDLSPFRKNSSTTDRTCINKSHDVLVDKRKCDVDEKIVQSDLTTTKCRSNEDSLCRTAGFRLINDPLTSSSKKYDIKQNTLEYRPTKQIVPPSKSFSKKPSCSDDVKCLSKSNVKSMKVKMGIESRSSKRLPKNQLSFLDSAAQTSVVRCDDNGTKNPVTSDETKHPSSALSWNNGRKKQIDSGLVQDQNVNSYQSYCRTQLKHEESRQTPPLTKKESFFEDKNIASSRKNNYKTEKFFDSKPNTAEHVSNRKPLKTDGSEVDSTDYWSDSPTLSLHDNVGISSSSSASFSHLDASIQDKGRKSENTILTNTQCIESSNDLQDQPGVVAESKQNFSLSFPNKFDDKDSSFETKLAETSQQHNIVDADNLALDSGEKCFSEFACEPEVNVNVETSGNDSVQSFDLEKEDQLKDNESNCYDVENDGITTCDASGISVSGERESLSDSISVTSKMSNNTSKRNKHPFVVILSNLPPSMRHQDVTALFEGNYAGFLKCLRIRQKGRAITVFLKAEQATYCAERIKGSFVLGRKIHACAKISDSNLDTNFIENTEVPCANEKVSGWLKSECCSAITSEKSSDVVGEEDQEFNDSGDEYIEREQYVVVIKNLPDCISCKKLYEIFCKKCPGIEETRLIEPGCGEIVFNNKKDLAVCLREKHSVEGKTLNVCRKAVDNSIKEKTSSRSDCYQQEIKENTEKRNLSKADKQQKQEAPDKPRKQRQQEGKQKQPQQQTKKDQKEQQRSQKERQQQQKQQQQQQIRKKKPQTIEQLLQKQQQQGQNHQEQKRSQNEQQQQQKKQPQTLPQQQQQLKKQKEKPERQSQQKLNEQTLQKTKQQQQPDNLQKQQRQTKQQHQQKLTKPTNNHTVQLVGFPPDTDEQDIRKFIGNKCQGVEIKNLVKSKQSCFVNLKSQQNCRKVYENLKRSSFNNVVIKTTWKRPQKQRKEDGPYVVVENLHPNFNKKDVENLFVKCQGVLKVMKESQNTYARVYFESIISAGKAIDQINQARAHGKKMKVKPSAGIFEDLEWMKIDQRFQKYLTDLKKQKNVLLVGNQEKLKDLESKIPCSKQRSKARRYISMEEFDRREKTKKTYEGKKQELIEQRNEFEKKFQQLLDSFNHKIEAHHSVSDRKGIEDILKIHKQITQREVKKFKASLPIYAKRTEILETVYGNQVVVLIGETGSGKSTQLAQYLAEENLNQGGKIVVTQPRKIAAISLAKRVSEEFGCEIGHEVGYHVGLERKINKKKTIIKFVTDRILLNEVLKGREMMQQYSYIIIDEAHERSIHTDLLVAMLKQQLTTFPELKLIVTSATLNTEVFRRYFDNCPVVKVPGRTFPVERIYTNLRPADYVDGVYDKVVEICDNGEQGDILVFLTQQNEIEKICDKLNKKLGTECIILPLHGKLQSDEQQKVFKAAPAGKRKIVVATNSAETSLTIDGIHIVIDSGMVKEPSFDPSRNMTTLDVKLVSQSSSKQRSGRAGRTGPGRCYCMYTEDDYNKMESSTKPEILKMHLGMAVLQLLSLGVTDIEQFDFVESPSPHALTKAVESLRLLGALNLEGTLNHLGEEMLQLPTEPQLSKALLEGLERGCGDDIIIAAALMASGHDVFYRGTVEKRNECAIQKQEFCQTSGDLLSAIDVYKQWCAKPAKEKVSWCNENALNSKVLRSTHETRKEIRHALSIIRQKVNLETTAENAEESLIKSLLAGYFENIAWSFGHEKLGYMAVLSSQKARIHPSSVLFCLGDQPEWVLYQHLKRTNDQVFLLNITPIKLEWLDEVAMHTLQYVDEDTIASSRVIPRRIKPVGPEMVKAVIGYQGSTIRKIETLVSHYSLAFPTLDRHAVFCALECDVEKGVVDVYTTADCLDYACTQVNDVIQAKKSELEQGYSEVVVSNVGGLKTLVAKDLKTRMILQPETFCKFDVLFEREDVSEEVDSYDILDVLGDAGNVIHFAICTNPKSERNVIRWGNVTYSEARGTEENTFFNNLEDNGGLPYNVSKIKLKPTQSETTAPAHNYTSSCGVQVVVTWFPLPASGKAYIKCNDKDTAEGIVVNVNGQVKPTLVQKRNTAFLQKSGDDIALHIQPTDDEFTIRKLLETSCTALQLENVSKITVPSQPSPFPVDLKTETEELMELMQDFGATQVLNTWFANCKKVRAALLFEDFDSAEDAILTLNGQMDMLGVRRIYLEFGNRRDIMCDGRMYEKIRKEIETMKNDELNIEVEQRPKRKKIIITGKNSQVVQTIGAKIARMVLPEVLVVNDVGITKLLSSGYGRAKVKEIQKKNDAIIYTSNFGRIQITARSEAKLKAREQIEMLIEELQKTTHLQIDLRHSAVGAIREILKHFGKDLKKLVEGEDCQATMEIRRRKLVLHGAKEAVSKVQNKAEEFLKSLPNSRRETSLNDECPVCFADIENPYLLTLCGHAYCSTCISQYLNEIFNKGKTPDMFPQKCLDEKCESSVIKDDYAALLNTDEMEKLYRVSLDCFLIGNSAGFKPCPTPDCSWVYEVTTKPRVFSCPECDLRLCTKCGDSAHKMFDTCEAFKTSKDPSQTDRLYNEWVKKANTKKCPKCSITLEKNGGCSHVRCTQCQAHICWSCGKDFLTEAKCYAHIPFCS